MEEKYNLISLVKAAAQIISSLKLNYGFIDSEYKYFRDTDSIKSVSIEKGEIVLYYIVSIREGFELHIRNKTWNEGITLGFLNFTSNYFNNFNERLLFFHQLKPIMDNHEVGTIEYYFVQMQFEIRFIAHHFPEVFENTDLTRIDRTKYLV